MVGASKSEVILFSWVPTWHPESLVLALGKPAALESGLWTILTGPFSPMYDSTTSSQIQLEQ